MQQLRSIYSVSREYQAIFREIGLVEAEAVFTHPAIRIWRSISERENGVLDATLADGRTIRLHVKRYHPVRAAKTPAEAEADGVFRLQLAGIPTVPLAAWGNMPDGRSFFISEDLAGHEAADKAIAAGFPFDRLLEPTAELAAKLHAKGLHHRDLYLCHFFVRADDQRVDLRLIDAGRVRYLPPWPLRQRWIVKDLAQFWYSTLQLPIADAQRMQWLEHCAAARQVGSAERLRRAIERKAAWIGRHDERLRAQPNRNVSIPGALG